MDHVELIKYAFKAFPDFCRNPYFTKRWKEFLDLLVTVQFQIVTSYSLVAPKLDVIYKQINAKHHFTMRHERPRSLIDGRFIEPEYTYDEAVLPPMVMTRKLYLR